MPRSPALNAEWLRGFVRRGSQVPDSAVPPGGYQWVEPGSEPAAGRRPGRRRWWLVTAAVVVVALVVGGVLVWRSRDSSSDAAGPQIGSPKDMLIPFSLLRQPVPGWSIRAADIGLPPKVHFGGVFASNGDKFFSITEDCGNRDCYQPPTYDEGPSTSFVYGLNLRTGAPLYPPVPLPHFGGSQCFGNGPSTAVCIGYDNDEKRAYVVDLEHGAVTYSGVNTLKNERKIGPDKGITTLVDLVDGEGIYGIGPHLEHTWFVPGEGNLDAPTYRDANGFPASPIAAESVKDGPDRVFSLADGKDLTPPPPPGTKAFTAKVYNGGFAYRFERGTEADVISFYDTTGRQLATKEFRRAYFEENLVMPTVLNGLSTTGGPNGGPGGGQWEVYTATGDLVAQIPPTDMVGSFITIGTTLFAQQSADLKHPYDQHPWQQWDLLTGKPAGPDCAMKLDGFSASDGRVILMSDNDYQAVVAIDRTTCKTVWQLPKFTSLEKVGTNLLRGDTPHDVLTSVHAPD
jgi:hypothetical protein